MKRPREMKTAVTSIATIVLVIWITCCATFQTVICRVPIRGSDPHEVVFIQEKPLIGGTAYYLIQIPGSTGFTTKAGAWLNSYNGVTPEQIRDHCRAEYDGKTLRVIGPRPRDGFEAGYTFSDDPQVKRNP